MAQTWLQLSVRGGKPDLELLSNFVFERGSPGVVLKRDGLDAFFLSSRDNRELRREIQRFVSVHARQPSRGRKPRLQWKIVDQQDWQHSWKRFIRPGRVGNSFWVTPPWLNPPNFRRRRVITIEPGMAFGTGTHATTRACMELLEYVAGKLNGQKFSVLDVGTGSGILAIAAVILGATEIWAIDNDPIAVKVASEKLRTNGVADKVLLSEKKLTQIRRKFSVVLGNLTAETIIELADALQNRVTRGGYLILSGILFPKAESVMRCFTVNFRVLKRQRKQEWVSVLLQRTT